MAQVVVLGPNGARTTANNVARPTDPIGPDGKPESELDRLLRGVIPGREGFKGGEEVGVVTEEYEGDSPGFKANEFRITASGNLEELEPPKARFTTKEEMAKRYPYLDSRLVDVLLNAYTETQDMEESLDEMRANPLMDEVFPGIRNKDTGVLRMTEVEYLSAVDTMQSYLRDYNLNPSVFADDIVAAIAGNVSPDEFGTRLELGYEGIINNIPEVKQAYLDNFGIDFPDEVIFSMFISPTVGDNILKGQILASQILAEAEVAGMGMVNVAFATSLARQGLTQTQAKEIFQTTSAVVPGLMGAAASQGRGLTEEQFIGSQLGEADDIQLVQRITEQQASQSAVNLGAAKAQTGEVTGLTEQ
tara:strand:+ start:17139 stop:18221 length:1083 start_codon:yes stop_codon:yes gene_type:complete